MMLGVLIANLLQYQSLFLVLSVDELRGEGESIDSQFYNACSENVSLFKHNWYIKEQFEPKTDFVFGYGWFHIQEKKRGEGRKLHPADPSCLRIHKTVKKISGIIFPTTEEEAHLSTKILNPNCQIQPKWHLFLPSVSGWFGGFEYLQFREFSAVRCRWESSKRNSSNDTEANRRNYAPGNIIDGDETGICYKCMSQRASVSKAGKHDPGFKATKDLVTLVFSASAQQRIMSQQPTAGFPTFYPISSRCPSTALQ